jgi:hypothetical protein
MVCVATTDRNLRGGKWDIVNADQPSRARGRVTHDLCGVGAVKKHFRSISIKSAGEHTFCSAERRRGVPAVEFVQLEAEMAVTNGAGGGPVTAQPAIAKLNLCEH